MRMILFLFVLISFKSMAGSCPSKGPNVILITWDGIRNQEFFRGTGMLLENKLPIKERGVVLTEFWDKYADSGLVLGGNNRYQIGSSVAVSLPSYQAIMTGRTTSCRKNNCESVKEETLMDSIKNKLNLKKKEVAVFASWNRIIAAISMSPDTVTHGIYPELFDDGSLDPVFKNIQTESMNDLPDWGGSRKDKYTYQMAKYYLEKHCPRFLYISLVDSDEFAHKGNYPGYVRSMRSYDSYLSDLIKFLDNSGEYGKNTTLILTTDHSRGAGPLWRGHGHATFTEKNIFLFARGRGVSPQGRQKLKGNHLMLRPTIESLFGISTDKPTLPGIQF